MPIIKLPAVGKRTQSATVRQWKKKINDSVNKGDILVLLETEEGLLELEAPVAGQLQQIIAAEGKTVPLDGPLAAIEETGKAEQIQNPKSNIQTMETKQPASLPPTVTPILMPKAGQSMEEGTIVKWRVQPGAKINKGDVIFEVETDKATMEVEATDAGRLSRIVLPEGGCIAVLQPVAYLADNDADVDAFIASSHQPSATSSQPETRNLEPAAQSSVLSSQPTVLTDSGRVKASPAARKVAKERNIDLTALPAGSGPEGRILSTDVPLTAPAAAAGTGGNTRKKMSQMRKAIARNLQQSKQTIPHFYVRLTITADPVLAYYKDEKAKYPCSINDVIIMACAKAIQEFPAFRSRLENDELVQFANSNVGFAVGMDDGLVVPVLMGAERMNLQQIANETKRLAANAKGGKIEGMGQGVFTITNLGMFGTEEFAGIINPPEAAILAIGAARETVIVKDGSMRIGKVMTMTLSADHRVIDGMLAAKFLARLKEILESPTQLQ